ncbi:hypothetical protein DV515_00018401 [Chloebia gouldiae]|uniref:RNase H type-1 domain-containing protein n=1 Tax=Chloebia gouldiae TaxID=44316 RepID=A0A3L8Q7L1_CHLGU|nr:hypothetical protein DV515_00018401 [Chloebia gouldiae]
MDNCGRENEKWDEIPYLDLFYYLGQKTEWQKECGIMALKVEDSQYECSGCKTWEVCMKCAAKSSRREEDLSLAIAPSAPPLSRERLGQERDEVESDTDEEEDEREVTDFDDSPGSQGNIQTPAASNSQARSPNKQRTPIAARTRHGRRNNEGPHMIAPLREAMGPQGGRVLIKVPFSPGDLVIWKQSAGSYREDPERVTRVVKMVIKTQNPDWNDLQVLLDTIMDSTEKEMVLRATKERAREEIKLRRSREQGYEGTVDELVPSDDPEWNPNSADGYRAIRKYQELLVEGVRTGMPKTLNWSKLYSVRQEKNESPSAFLERLKETARRYTNLEIDEEPGGRVKLEIPDEEIGKIFVIQEVDPTPIPDEISNAVVPWDRGTCVNLTIALLNMLGQAGYRVSKEKAQLVRKSVLYLGCELAQGQRHLGTNRVEAICSIPLPRSHQELRSFLGMVGWCRLWILNFGLIAKPLYEALKEPQLDWTPVRKKAFLDLKQALKEAPALGLPDLNKDFQLYVYERQKLALGVLTQKLGSWKRPVGYFSKQLDAVSTGWPPCLRAVAATVLLIQEAWKLTLGRKIDVYVPHMVMAVLEQKGSHWLSSSRMLQYQAILREQDDVQLQTTSHLNPAEFLRSEVIEDELVHDCVEMIEQVYSSRQDLKDEPLDTADWELFTDGSSFVENGTRYAGYSVVTVFQVIEARALTPGTSAQKAEIIGLTRALILSTGRKVNIWTDSKYAFGVVHIHGALWRERGLLSSQGTAIKHQEEVVALLDAVHKPEQVAVMHVRGHQKEDGKIFRGNRLADAAAREAARQVWTQMALIPTRTNPANPYLQQPPRYSREDEKLAALLKANKNATGWYVTNTGQVVVPSWIMKAILVAEHNKSHWGAEALVKFLKSEIVSNRMLSLAKRVNAMCSNPQRLEGERYSGTDLFP